MKKLSPQIQQELDAEPDYKKQVELLLKKVDVNFNYNLSDYILYTDLAKKIAKLHNDEVVLAHVYAKKALICLHRQKYKAAFSTLIKVKEVYLNKHYKEGLCKLAYTLSYYYVSTNMLEEALKSIDETIELAKEVEDYYILANSYNILGAIHYSLGKQERAVDSFLKTIEVEKKIINGSVPILGICYSNLARVYSDMGKYELAIEYNQKALKIYEANSNLSSTLYILIQVAHAYKLKGDFTRSKEYYCQILDHKLQDYSVKPVARAELAEILLSENDSKKATELIEELERELPNVVTPATLKTVNKTLSDFYISKLNYKKGFEFFQKYHEIEKLVDSENIKFKVQRLELNSQVELLKRESEIKQLKNVELKKAYDEIEEQHKEIKSSIKYAQLLQSAFIADEHYVERVLGDAFILFNPRDLVSGDFYWHAIVDDLVYFAVADCTGHGVPGAFLSLLFTSYLDTTVKDIVHARPIQIVENVQYLFSRLQKDKTHTINDGMEIALCMLDRKNKKVLFAGANRPMVLIRNGELMEQKGSKRSIGMGNLGLEQKFEEHYFDLFPGDRIYLYSDGFADQFGGERNKRFTTAKLKQLLCSVSSEKMMDQKSVIQKVLLDWQGMGPQTDDITVMGITV